ERAAGRTLALAGRLTVVERWAHSGRGRARGRTLGRTLGRTHAGFLASEGHGPPSTAGTASTTWPRTVNQRVSEITDGGESVNWGFRFGRLCRSRCCDPKRRYAAKPRSRQRGPKARSETTDSPSYRRSNRNSVKSAGGHALRRTSKQHLELPLLSQHSATLAPVTPATSSSMARQTPGCTRTASDSGQACPLRR